MPQNLKNIISAKFKRTFVDGLQHTWLFDDAPENIKWHFKQALGTKTALNIIIACYFTENDWFVVTTETIIIEKNNLRQSISFSDISNIDCNFTKLAANKSKPFDIIDIYTANCIVPFEVEKRTWGPWVDVLKLLIN